MGAGISLPGVSTHTGGVRGAGKLFSPHTGTVQLLQYLQSPSPVPGLCLTQGMVILSQALPYVALLIVMLFFIYAVIGMQVRGTRAGGWGLVFIRCPEPDGTRGGGTGRDWFLC